jgi:GntR family transcriptional repressor for pyruvate dehydrogenase complex
MLEPLRKTRLYEEIVKQLTDLIEEGKLLPGDKLPAERQLADELHVSRTAIREALRSMESMGYIESKVGGGTFVKAISLDNVLHPFSAVLSQNKKLIAELLEVRQLLEAEIANLAAKRCTPEDLVLIQASLDEMCSDIESGGIGLKGDNDFHTALAIASKNSAMSEILHMCAGLLSKSRQTTLRIPGQPIKSLEDHQAIFNAIKNGSAILASELMKDHIKKAIANFNSNYQDDSDI